MSCPASTSPNDPLLQGRNFSYLDTQLKRLGGPNFTHIPVNAPKCPVMHFQQDGHMAMRNPATRANYEPNSWSGEEGGPREDPARGFPVYEDAVGPAKRRVRPERFADHYSQARQFYVSQTETEQRHIRNAFVFELSKCDEERIRLRIVAGLRNVDEELARSVAEGLGVAELPDALPPARDPITDLEPSPALSIIANGPGNLSGRKLGILATDGSDAGTLAALTETAERQGVTVELIADTVGGFTDSDGNAVPAHQKLDGAPSVLYDLVVVLTDEAGAAKLADQPPARDFVSDAFAHCKFIGHTAAAAKVFEAIGIAGKLDDGFVALDDPSSVASLFEAAGKLRHWEREKAFA